MANRLVDRVIVPRGEGRGAPLARHPAPALAATKVGATGKVETPLSASLDDVRGYILTMDHAIDSLWDDVRGQLVWIDPADVSKWGTGTEVTDLAARAAAHGPVRSADEIAFARRVNDFRTVQWPEAKAGIMVGMDSKVPGPGVTYATPSQRWNNVRLEHVKVAAKYTEFRSLGGAPTNDPGPAPEPIDKTDPGFVAGKVAKALPWWVWPIAITAGGIAGYVYLVRPLLPTKATST